MRSHWERILGLDRQLNSLPNSNHSKSSNFAIKKWFQAFRVKDVFVFGGLIAWIFIVVITNDRTGTFVHTNWSRMMELSFTALFDITTHIIMCTLSLGLPFSLSSL